MNVHLRAAVLSEPPRRGFEGQRVGVAVPGHPRESEP